MSSDISGTASQPLLAHGVASTLDEIVRHHDDDALLDRLATMTAWDYKRSPERQMAADELDVALRDLDIEVARRRKLADDSKGRAVELYEPEPWSAPVDGANLLSNVAQAIRKHVGMSSASADATALWVVHAHAIDAADISPVLAIISPTPECGKTTTLTVISLAVTRPLMAANLTAAAVFRAVEKWQPTLIIDEADTFLRDNDELRGVLNSGHNKESAYVVRTVGDDHEPKRFRTWGAKAVALIGKLPATLSSRSIAIELRRLGANESVTPIRGNRDYILHLARLAARWAADHVEELRTAEPDMPAALRGRRADNWRALLAIADAAGGDWPGRARRAAVELSGGPREETAGVEVLEDIRAIFDDKQATGLSSAEIVEALSKMEDRPWPEWSQGKPITTRQLAKLLEPFKIRPATIRLSITGKPTAKGYTLADFADAFARYIPEIPPFRSVTPSQPPEISHF